MSKNFHEPFHVNLERLHIQLQLEIPRQEDDMTKEEAKLAVSTLCGEIITLCADLHQEIKRCGQQADDAKDENASRLYESFGEDVEQMSSVAEAIKADLEANQIGASTQHLMYYVCKQTTLDLMRITERTDLQSQINFKFARLRTAVVNCT